MKRSLQVAVAAAALALCAAPTLLAHCDTLGGPVVKDARAALDSGRPEPALRWVTPDRETEVRNAFTLTLAVRAKGDDARALADRFFFETLVRIHREGEGAPYTGLKPAGHVDPAIAAAERALDTGSIEGLARDLASAAETGLRERFRRALAARAHAGESVARGREAVAAYVEYVHYAERLLAATGAAAAPHHVHETPHIP
jgi:hypothetical protein